MLSTMNGTHPGQRLHRRMNSTPNAAQGMTIPNLSINPQQRQRQQRQNASHHRRGLSLDIRRQNSTSPTAGQDFMHRVLREAQQQRTQARPGLQTTYVTLAPSGGSTYLVSPHGTPQTQRFDTSCFDPNTIPFDPYAADLNVMMVRAQSGLRENVAESRDFDLFNAESAISTPTFSSFQDSANGSGWTSEGDTTSTRRHSRRISNGIMDRVVKYENIGMDELQRPMTPQSQNAQGYYPPTPMETPQQQPGPNRFAEGYDESMEETIRPTRNQGGGRRAQDVFQSMRQQAEQDPLPTTPSTNPLPNSEMFNGYQVQNTDFLDMPGFQVQVNLKSGLARSQSEPQTQEILDQDVSVTNTQQAMMAQWINHQARQAMPQPGSDGRTMPSASQVEPDAETQAAPTRHTHRRNQSTVSNATDISLGGLNIEETRTDTGITLEQISEYMKGPDSADGKWMCTFEDCGKKFGRKENIKSHVQTHLNDRQYRCPECSKCFVRQHDLKRHAKIHTGVKNYLCPCGNSFARHDALTRHRQRGMCIGAFDGVVRKVARRGRPPKNRPDMETRKEKSARTRRKNLSISSVSSLSGYSDISEANSPEEDFYMLDVGLNSQTTTIGMSSQAPMPTASSAPMPSASRSMASSSPAASVHSYVSPEAIMEHIPSHPPTPGSIASHFPTPGLSQASSPPPSQFFDLDVNNPIEDPADLFSSGSLTETMSLGLNPDDDDIMLQLTDVDGLVLDRDASGIAMTKFDEQYNALIQDDDDFFDTSSI